MKHGLLFGLLLAGWSALAIAQTGPEIPVDDTQTQRARIEDLRQQRSAELDIQDTACLARFAVADCQIKVAVRRRQMLAEFKLEETKLNAIERQQKQQEQLLRTQQKTLDSAQRQQQARAAAQQNQSIDRQQVLADKRRTHKAQAQTDRTSVPSGKSSNVQDAAAIQKNREAYLEKQKALKQRRQDRDQRINDQGKAAAPLPLPP